VTFHFESRIIAMSEHDKDLLNVYLAVLIHPT